MAESARYVAVVGIDYQDHRAEPGEELDWLPEKAARRLLREKAIQKAPQKPVAEAAGSAEAAPDADQAPTATPDQTEAPSEPVAPEGGEHE